MTNLYFERVHHLENIALNLKCHICVQTSNQLKVDSVVLIYLNFNNI